MKRILIILNVILAVTISSCSSKKAVPVNRRGIQSTYIIDSSDKEVGRLIKEARSWIGTPYAYGRAEKRRGTDCSGFIMSLFNGVYNVQLPRSSAMQQEFSQPIKFERLQPGDLVFFTTGKSSSRVNHVGLYVGNGKMIHASTSRGVMESALSEKYWKNTYHSSGAVINPDRKTPKDTQIAGATTTLKAKKTKQSKQPKQPPRPPQKNVPSVPARNLQSLYNALDHQIDSIYVSNPEIFD